MEDALIYTLSETSGRLRVFENGKTIFSPNPQEIQEHPKVLTEYAA